MPQSCERRNAITSCSSSLEGACTRISSPWIDACAFLNFRSLIALTIAFAFSCGIPCVSLISRRTLSFAAEVTSPSSRVFTAQPRQGLLFHLSHPLPRDPGQGPDLLEGHRLLTLEAEIEVQDLGLPFLQGREHFLDRLGQGVLEDLVVGTGVLRVGEVVEQLVVLARGQGGVQREVRLGDREGLRDLFLGYVHPLGDLLHGGLAAELLEQRGGALADAM